MLADIALFLAATVIAVPLFKRLGLGAVPGYLAAGVVIGPAGLGLIPDVERVYEFSEFGVVLLLFVIGLELQPSRLWRLRTQVLGMGGAQVLLTTALLAGIALALKLTPQAALVAGFGLSMSSTAFVLQMLAERKELADRHGRAAFAVLLFQDLAVIPFLAIVPMLGEHGSEASGGSLWLGALKLVGALAVVGIGRYLLRPVLRGLAATQVPEVFTAAALLLVSATALLMNWVGLSMSLGAFLAGVLLADSEYRHELQADIEPFKGLLLGLFFIAVGMSADLGVLLREPQRVLGVVAGLILVKAAILWLIGRFAGLPVHNANALALALSQGGEFAFVLFGVAATSGLIAQPMHELLVVSVTLSMIATPLLYAASGRLRRSPAEEQRPYDEIEVPENEVIIAGFGPFGQIVGRILGLKKIPYTVLERNWEQVDFVRQFGSRVFYSDAGRVEVLRVARADKARFFVLAVADVEESLRIAETVRRNFPHLRVFASARDRRHAMQLMDLGITDVIRRSYGSSLETTSALLKALGEPDAQVRRDIERFRRHDRDTLLRQQAVYRDEKQLLQTAREAREELALLFEADQAERGPAD
jgi:monovalent cation:proton antiporter-2 (CPA2) family protein